MASHVLRKNKVKEKLVHKIITVLHFYRKAPHLHFFYTNMLMKVPMVFIDDEISSTQMMNRSSHLTYLQICIFTIADL